VHGLLSRRGFLNSAAKYAAGAVTAELLLEQLTPNFAMAQQVPASDSRLQARYVEVPSPQGYGKLRGYLVQPAQARGKQPTVLVLPQGNGKVGVVGFCYGGTVANYLVTQLPDLAAVVPFYGGQPSAEEAARIKAPLLLHYAGNDERVNAGWPAYEAALKAAHVSYQAYVYPGVEHGFNNDTTPRYDAAAAKLAWQRTVAFFNQHLRSSIS
jgi:dienelactone hydrolase